MLFDLQGRRKTFIKGIYLGLAILLGGGLVLFGVGSNVSGGLADYFTNDAGTDTGDYAKRVTAAEVKVKKDPENEKALEELIRARYLLAGAGNNYNQETLEFSEEGKAVLTQLGKDWNAYVKVTDEPDPTIAIFAVQSFINLQDAAGAASAQQVVATSREESTDYLALFQYALAAGNQRLADLSARKALALVPAADRKQMKNQIADLRKRYKDAQKEQINEQVQQQVNEQLGSGGGAGGLGGLGTGTPAPAPAP